MTALEIDPAKVGADEVREIVEMARTQAIGEERYFKLRAVVEDRAALLHTIERQEITIANYQRMLFGPTSERFEGEPTDPKKPGGTEKSTEPEKPTVPEASKKAEKRSSTGDEGSSNKKLVDEDIGNEEPTGEDAADESGEQADRCPRQRADQEEEEEEEPKPKPKGHGRNGADAYTGADDVDVPHEKLKPGDCCPDCGKGNLYEYSKPQVDVHVRGNPLLTATRNHRQRLRCSSCTALFTAKAPKGTEKKYDESAVASIADGRFLRGIPHNRIAEMQEDFGVPVSASTQWELLNKAFEELRPVLDQLWLEAALAWLIYVDDTVMIILTRKGLRRVTREEAGEDLGKRVGVRTTAIVAVREEFKIILFRTSDNHAGDNMEDLLEKRPDHLDKPIQMCDPLSHNTCGDFVVYLAMCLMHARRVFYELRMKFPKECGWVLSAIGKVYKHDAEAKAMGMSDEMRMHYHRRKSKPLLDKARRRLNKLLKTDQVEKNSLLGKAITYFDKHYREFTLFLRMPRAPLDNGEAERTLKKAIIHRNNSLFYLSEKGAEVGDLFMSLGLTAKACGVSPHHYFTALLRYAKEARQSPADWMPWNYVEAMARGRDP